MKPTTAPCPGMTRPRWEKMRETAIAFLDEFGDDAAALDQISERISVRNSPWGKEIGSK